MAAPNKFAPLLLLVLCEDWRWCWELGVRSWRSLRRWPPCVGFCACSSPAWRCGSGVVGRFWALYRRRCSGILVVPAVSGCGVQAFSAGRGGVERSASGVTLYLVCLLPSLAGRGGEERRWFQDLLAAGSPASWGGAQCRDRWKSGGCGKMAPWPCALSVLQLRCLRRTAYAVVYMCGVVPFPGFAAAWRLLLRRRSATKDLLRRCGGSAATPFAAVVLGVLCLYCCVFRFCTHILC